MDCKKSYFQLDPSITFINGAYMSPLLKSVEQVGIEGILRKRNPVHIPPETFFGESDELRKSFGRLVNTQDYNRIAIIPSVSYGMANVANNLNLNPNDEIVLADAQFPSNVYSWHVTAKRSDAKIVTVSPPKENKNRGEVWNQKILDAINPKTRLVALGHIHWADGTLFDLEAIREKTYKVGALLVIDGTQSIGALPFDIHKFKPDALIVAGYKWMMGPYSLGLAYYGEAFDNGNPIEENWINRENSEDFSNLVNYNPNYKEKAIRYEVGEHSNFILVPMLMESINTLNSWGIDNIQEYCRKLTQKPIAEFRKLGFWVEEESRRASHLFGLRLGENQNMDDIKQRLTAANISVSFRGDSIRISPHVYNDEQDFEKMIEALQIDKRQ